jgi:predicted nucleic acid-binding protein
MRYLLDTNIISDIVKLTPSQSLLAWLSEQYDQDLYIASLTIAEIRRGIFSRLLILLRFSSGRRLFPVTFADNL